MHRYTAPDAPPTETDHKPPGTVTGTILNVAAVLVGGGIGTLAGARLPEGMRETALHAIGIITLLVGVANFLK
jgi:uncharacterized membrane protein YqgA involved in biofilm formation